MIQTLPTNPTRTAEAPDHTCTEPPSDEALLNTLVEAAEVRVAREREAERAAAERAAAARRRAAAERRYTFD